MALDGTPIIVKKKKAHSHQSHGGSWKVAYADFVTAMMAFFMVLWIMGLSDQTRTQVAGYFNDPLGYAKTPPLSRNIIKMPNMESPKPGESKAPGSEQATGSTQIEAQIKSILKLNSPNLKGLIKQTEVTWGKDGTRIEFSEGKNTQFFQVGSKDLTPAARMYVGLLAPALIKMRATMSVEGYTDARKYQGSYDNIDLSSERALSLKAALEASGVPQRNFISALGYGDQRLKLPNQPYAVQNRRVTIWIHPGYAVEKLIKLDDFSLKQEARAAIGPGQVSLAPEEAKIPDK